MSAIDIQKPKLEFLAGIAFKPVLSAVLFLIAALAPHMTQADVPVMTSLGAMVSPLRGPT